MKRLKIVLTRTDKIGDVVMITPAITALRQKYPDAHISLLIKPYTYDIVKNNPDINEIILEKSFFEMLREIKSKKFDIAVVFFVNFKVAFLTFLAGIPLRIGPASKAWSFFLTKKVFQYRSRIEKHEAEYNIELLGHFGIDTFGKHGLSIAVGEKESLKMKKLLLEMGIKKDNLLIGIHPGSKFSARNWPKEKYAQLSDRIIKEINNVHVLFTGSDQEQGLMNEIAALMKEKPVILREKISLGDLMALISFCNVFITNSTGPLHIAVAQNIPTVSFYPPIKVCSPKRWGPYTENKEIYRVLMPKVAECRKCIKKKCSVYDCMDRITVEDAFCSFREVLTRCYQFQ